MDKKEMMFKLKDTLKTKGFSQSDIASTIGVSGKTVSIWFGERGSITIDHLFELIEMSGLHLSFTNQDTETIITKSKQSDYDKKEIELESLKRKLKVINELTKEGMS